MKEARIDDGYMKGPDKVTVMRERIPAVGGWLERICELLQCKGIHNRNARRSRRIFWRAAAPTSEVSIRGCGESDGCKLPPLADANGR